MAIQNFDTNTALSLLESTEQFPVDFELAWQWLGYSSKQKAKSKLTRNFEKDVAYSTKWVKTSTGGRPGEEIRLTIDCFKALGMMAGTEKGKEVRQYFLDCESHLKNAIGVIGHQSEELRKMELENENMRLKLQVYEAQQKTLAAAGMLALTAPAVVEAIICPGVTIIEKVEEKHVTVLVNSSGQSLAKYDGVGITDIQRRFGFKSTKQAWAWLDSIGYGSNSGLWKEEKIAVNSPRLAYGHIKELDQKFRSKKGERQQLMGEF